MINLMIVRVILLIISGLNIFISIKNYQRNWSHIHPLFQISRQITWFFTPATIYYMTIGNDVLTNEIFYAIIVLYIVSYVFLLKSYIKNKTYVYQDDRYDLFGRERRKDLRLRKEDDIRSLNQKKISHDKLRKFMKENNIN